MPVLEEILRILRKEWDVPLAFQYFLLQALSFSSLVRCGIIQHCVLPEVNVSNDQINRDSHGLKALTHHHKSCLASICCLFFRAWGSNPVGRVLKQVYYEGVPWQPKEAGKSQKIVPCKTVLRFEHWGSGREKWLQGWLSAARTSATRSCRTSPYLGGQEWRCRKY